MINALLGGALIGSAVSLMLLFNGRVTGICPGPGMVSMMSGDYRLLVFVVSMLVGMFIFKTIEKKLS